MYLDLFAAAHVQSIRGYPLTKRMFLFLNELPPLPITSETITSMEGYFDLMCLDNPYLFLYPYIAKSPHAYKTLIHHL